MNVVLGVGRQRQEAEHVREPDPEEEGGEEGEPAGGHRAVEAAAGDRVLGQVVGDLDRGLHPVGLLVHPARDPDHGEDRQGAGQEQVEDRLVDAEVDAGEVDRDPRFELELVLRLERLRPCRRCRRSAASGSRRRGRRRPRSGLWFWSSSPPPGPPGSKRWASPWAAKEIVKRTEDQDRRGEAGLAFGRGRRAARRSPSARPGRAWSRRSSPSPAGGCRRRAPRRRGGRRASGCRAGRARRRRRRRSPASGIRQARRQPARRPAPLGRRTWEET